MNYCIRLAVDTGSTGRLYRGTFDCLRTTYLTEGVRGVYAGLAISLTGAILFRAMFMGGYDIIKSLYDLEHRGVGVRLLVAQGVTTVTGTLCYPIDTVKRRMMVQKVRVK
jgi:solute carrier family 25 (adenine nucleotide translocator) protein 4/5/6/31